MDLMKDKPLTIERKLNEIAAIFEQAQLYFGHGTETAWDEAAWLIAHVLGISPQNEQLDAETVIPKEQDVRISKLVEDRVKTRKPLAYLINSAWFCGLEFYVDERVIVPRSPIAELIANEFTPWLSKAPQHILDLCTGSGCIAVACAVQYPQVQILATDIDPAALEVARMNTERHNVADRVRLYQADLLDGLPTGRFDLILCNPPYVGAKDMAGLPVEYSHEPQQALAAGADGLDAVRRILRAVGNFLEPDGVLICEVGNGQETLCEVYPRIPFTWVEFDYGGQGVFVLAANEMPAEAI